MIPRECKRLAEVDFPIAVVSRHSAREKSIRHGHPSTLHLWWARRPLAACRAMLMALLLPDPCDPNCPEEFKQRARSILPRVQGKPGATNLELRKELLRFIGDFANWDNSANPTYLEAARGLVRAAHADEAPLVVDPFAGGGSIPLEALRIGCDAFASDLNPVACLILKSLLENIPSHGDSLADELRKSGAEVKAAAEKELAEFYPPDSDGSRPIAYLWARTITCDNCGSEIPLMRSFWLSKKSGRKRALNCRVARNGKGPSETEFHIFQPREDSEVPSGTVTRARATCLCCHSTMGPERVRTQLRAQDGGAGVIFDQRGKRSGGARLLAVVVTLKSGHRAFREAAESDYRPIVKAQDRLNSLTGQRLENGLEEVPDEELPPRNTLGLRVPNYGVNKWIRLFSPRQAMSLTRLCSLIRNLKTDTAQEGALQELMALAVSRTSDYCSANCSLHAGRDVVRNTWARNALPVVWDYYESVPWQEASGNFEGAVHWIAQVVEEIGRARLKRGQVHASDACEMPLPDSTSDVWFSDPPYYGAIGYAESADFFYVWLKRLLNHHPLLRDPYDPHNALTPKKRECIQDGTFEKIAGITKDRSFFENTMARAFGEARRVLRSDGIGSVVFAHKTTEGWEALIEGMFRAGLTVTASWPIETEMKNKVSGSQGGEQKAMLLASVHLAFRPRAEDASVGDWGDVLRELPQRVGDWIERLQAEGIKGADLVFACIGPAMEIYSRYRRVEDAEGREISLGGDPTAAEPYQRGFLAYVWETVGRLALEEVLGTAEAKARNGAAGALEEDSRLTALFLWTLQSTQTDVVAANGDADEASEDEEDSEEEDAKPAKKKKSGYTLIYDVARRFAQPLGIHLEKWEGRIIETDKGIVRLLPVTERAAALFGEADAAAISRRIEEDVRASRNYAFAFMQEDTAATPQIKGRGRGKKAVTKGGAAAAEAQAPQPVTTLDRLHAAMLLQRSGQTNGLRALLKDEMQRGPDFLRLANALSRLYPKDSDEKRLLDAMLLAIPRS
jgi:putative DNA methylase